MVGCVAKSTALDNLYVTKLSTNETYDIQLRVGYFGKLKRPSLRRQR